MKLHLFLNLFVFLCLLKLFNTLVLTIRFIGFTNGTELNLSIKVVLILFTKHIIDVFFIKLVVFTMFKITMFLS